MPPDRLHPARVAWEAQAEILSRWLRELPDPGNAEDAVGPADPTRVAAELADALGRPRPPVRSRGITAAAHLAGRAAGGPAAIGGGGAGPAAAAAAFEAASARVAAGLDALGGADPLLAGARGPIRASELLGVGVVDLVLLGGEAAHLRSGHPPGPPAPSAVRVAVRTLAAVLAERHPGRSVEVRVPPHAAVQIGDGPVHTRGTPPNVVETSAPVFLALVAGRRSFAGAVAAGEVRASGARADLTPYLPLLT